MIPAEVWIGLAVLFGGVWIVLRVVEFRRRAKRVNVNSQTVPAANLLAEAYGALLARSGEGLLDPSALPASKNDIARALKVLMVYHAAHGDQRTTYSYKGAYLALARFQEPGRDGRRSQSAADSERRRLSQDIEHFLASTSL